MMWRRRFAAVTGGGKKCHIALYDPQSRVTAETDVTVPSGQSLGILAEPVSFSGQYETEYYVVHISANKAELATLDSYKANWGSSPLIDKEYLNGVELQNDEIPAEINIYFGETAWK